MRTGREAENQKSEAESKGWQSFQTPLNWRLIYDRAASMLATSKHE
jgi:hypothetical protein